MKYTQNYNLKLPEETNIIDVTVLNSNFETIDGELNTISKSLEDVSLTNTLKVISAYGLTSFYHGTQSGVTKLLSGVETTFGKAEFRGSYGTYSSTAGSVINLYVVLAVQNGTIYWDEHYNTSEAPSNAAYIGGGTCYTSGADTKVEFDYIDDEANAATKLSLREAIMELMYQVQILKGE